MSSLAAWLAVGPVGALGAVARFGVDRAVAARTPAAPIPLGTHTVNVLGAFLLGVLTGLGVDGDAALILGGAFLGAFTTFSTWMLDTHRTAAHGGPRPAAVNILAGVTAGLLAAGTGWAAGVALAGL